MPGLSAFPRVHRQPGDQAVRGNCIDALCVGPWREREFAEILSSVDQSSKWHAAASVEQALDCLAMSDVAPELIFLAQPLPGDYRQAQIDRLQRLAPLARMIVVAGTWCEGELRNLKPLAGVVRIYWYEFPAWWRAAQAQIGSGLCPLWSQPLDGSLSGRVTRQPGMTTTSAGAVAIATDDYSVFDTWAEALAMFDRRAVWQRSGVAANVSREISAGIWDGGQLNDRERESLETFCRASQTPRRPVVVLLDFPRLEHVRFARAIGASAVFGKPYVVDEVVAALE